MKDKINTKELNEVIGTSNKILKLFYAFMIVLLVIGGTFILKEWNVLGTIGKVLSVISPFFIGFIMAWLLNPLVKYFQIKGMNRAMGVTLVYLMLFILLYLFCLAVIPTLIDQLNDMAKMIPDFVINVKDIINETFNNLSSSINVDLSDTNADFIKYIEKFALDLTTDLPSRIINIVQDLISGVGKFGIGLIIGFYLLYNFDNVKKHIYNVIPKKFKEDAKIIFEDVSEVLYKFVNGTLLISLILFIVSAIGFSLIGIDAPILFAFFCAVTNIIPYVGPYIGGIPAILIGFSSSTLTGILMLIFIVVTQTLEGNILHPIVIGKKMDLHPITIILSLLIFEYFFGIVGMIIATPIVAILKILYVFFDNKYHFFGYKEIRRVKRVTK